MALCPHCRNALPETGTRYCPNCGGDVDLPSATTPSHSDGAPPPLPSGAGLPPTGGGGHGAPPPAGTPWEDRERLGFVNALIETTKQVMTQPAAFYRAMPTSGGVGSPLLYAVIIGWIGTVLASFYLALFQSIADPAALGGDVPAWMTSSTPFEVWGGFVANVIFGPIGEAIAVFVAGGILHLSLLLIGGAQRNFEATFRVVCYSRAPSILMIIPFCGWFVAPVWTLVLYVIGLQHAHRIGTGKAVLGVLLPAALFCCCCAGLLFLVWGFVAAAVAGLNQ
jgi:hypothetical protein